MDTLPKLSQSDLQALGALHRAVNGQGTVTLNPANETHRAGIEASLRAAGREADRYPALHAQLDGKAGSEGDEHSQLIDSGSDRGGRATAQVWHRGDGAPLFMGSSLFALHSEQDAVVAHGHNSSLNGFLATSTDTHTAQPAPEKFRLLHVAHSTYPDGSTRFTALGSDALASPQPATRAAAEDDDDDADVTITEPVITVTGNTEVVIALGRDSGHTNPDADYTYVEPSNVGTPYLIVPFAGQAAMAYEISGTMGEPVEGAVLTTQLYFVKTDGTTLTIDLNSTYTPATRLADGVVINPADQYLLEFSYPADGNSYTNTSSLVYDQESLTNEQISYFFYQFQIPVQNAPVTTYTFAVCSEGTPNQPSVQCVEINNLQFWWHCLAEGTQVRLADGGEAGIETLDNTHRVRTAHGGDLAVEATSMGPHQGSAGAPGLGAVYHLRTSCGRELVATGSHPIATPTGLIAIADLEAGGSVLTEDGVSEVKAVEGIDHEGQFFNLKLGDQADRARAGGGLIGTYLANGIAVGDHAAMAAQSTARRRDLDFMLPRLPEGQHRDYVSAVEDVRY
ncbi:MAG: hypothetical protein SX243_07100 [Acidobacteriota bacterium]|nr:hypothetical protein [Acidobacteriota bacterium]